MVAQSSSRFSSMLAFFFVALVIVTPFALVQIRRILRTRAERDATRGGPEPASAPAAPEVPADDLAHVVAAIAEGAAGPGPFEIRIPASPSHEGRAVPPDVAGDIVADALRRSRIVVTERRRGPDGEWWRCDRTE